MKGWVSIMQVKRGEVYFANLDGVVGSEQGGVRPVLIIQNDIGNKFSPTVIAATITSQSGKKKLPTHINIESGDGGVNRDSVILLEQVRTIDKSRLKSKIGNLSLASMSKVNVAFCVSVGLNVDALQSILKEMNYVA